MFTVDNITEILKKIEEASIDEIIELFEIENQIIVFSNNTIELDRLLKSNRIFVYNDLTNKWHIRSDSKNVVNDSRTIVNSSVNTISSALTSKGYTVNELSGGNYAIKFDGNHLIEWGPRIKMNKALIKNKKLYKYLSDDDVVALQNTEPKTHPYGIDFECNDIVKLAELLKTKLS